MNERYYLILPTEPTKKGYRIYREYKSGKKETIAYFSTYREANKYFHDSLSEWEKDWRSYDKDSISTETHTDSTLLV